MTAATLDVVPEVVAVKAQLATFEDRFRSDDLEAAAVRRAQALALVRELGEHAASVNARVAAALDIAAAGDLSAIPELAASQALLTAVETVRARVVVPELPGDLVTALLNQADLALSQSDGSLSVPELDYDADISWWRRASERAGQVYEPPVCTDAERIASGRLAALAREVDTVIGHHRAWSEAARQPGVDPLIFLASAAGQLEQRQELTNRAAELAAAVTRANAARAKAGHRWQHPGGPSFVD